MCSFFCKLECLMVVFPLKAGHILLNKSCWRCILCCLYFKFRCILNSALYLYFSENNTGPSNQSPQKRMCFFLNFNYKVELFLTQKMNCQNIWTVWMSLFSMFNNYVFGANSNFVLNTVTGAPCHWAYPYLNGQLRWRGDGNGQTWVGILLGVCSRGLCYCNKDVPPEWRLQKWP